MDETSYKIVLGVLTVWMFLTRAFYQERARWPRSTQPAVSTAERLLAASTSLWLLPAALYIFSGWLDGLDLSLPDPIRKSGAVIFSFGILLYWWAHAVLDRNLTPFAEPKSNQRLVTSGPYAFIRHPIYTAVFLSGLGLLLLTANWLISLTYLLPVFLLYRLRVGVEEHLLEEQFGQVYRDYTARTGRLLPRLTPPRRIS